MENAQVKFFLSANTPQGFVCRFEQLVNPAEGWRCFVLKGCAGGGKSTMLKQIAERFRSRLEHIEYIYCSSAPDSLDAVILHDLKISVVDGTPPHEGVLE